MATAQTRKTPLGRWFMLVLLPLVVGLVVFLVLTRPDVAIGLLKALFGALDAVGHTLARWLGGA